ncbi:cysteine synthase A [Mesonia hippocampi]|uniref:Cysteine synthase n=1 Tax=Mesonia hippocampi TaxID=1628250 RepID=A0A840ETU4_9FLAO|nr:cysteine synthase A [Mesonia hippocampi]MBB4118317.1 cysteine synthase A [Mesonia hippocampi]
MKANSILELIGNTPVVNLKRTYESHPNVWIKTEKNNPGGSIKDRIALAMIEDAEQNGALQKDGVIIEPTSGNTGIGLAMVGAVKGYKVILVMPESMSVERRKLMEVYGAEFVLTPKEKGMKGAIEKAMAMVAENPKAWSPKQFDNSVNVEAHRQTTAQEIIKDFPEGIDYLVTGVGTGGHITGVAKVLKEQFPTLKVYAVEPAQSPVLSGGEPGPHPLQGIGAGFEPSIYESSLIDGVLTVEKEEAFNYAKKVALKEGLLGGISTGASLAAVAKLLPEIPENAKVLTFNYDTGERYLSVEGLF